MTPRDLRTEWLGTGSGVRLRWRVDLLATAMLTWTHVEVFSRANEAAPWVATGAPVLLVAGTNEYSLDHVAGTETTLYTVALWVAGPTVGDYASQVVGSGGGRYATVQDVRDEGIAAPEHDNARVRKMILKAEAWLERTTRRFFYPRELSLRFGGNGNRILPIHVPLIQIDSVETLSSDWPTDPSNDVALASVQVYNRHLTMGLASDDDRDNPRLILESGSYWPPGRQNIQLTGWFGYTELAPNEEPGETSSGSQVPLSRGDTPPDIKEVAMRLTIRRLPQAGDPDEEDFWTQRHRVSRWKTRDQEIQLLSPKSAGGIVGQFTGDPLIDNIVAQFSAPATGRMV
ncbi:hypothetical protein LCGC14_0258800 [marine sediment metagenome]|uniref:Uncharacterized protein n=1 Tax=marine sediment metagenome TaxID=412755 RepID=A0A0F9U2G0_9ZZZZ